MRRAVAISTVLLAVLAGSASASPAVVPDKGFSGDGRVTTTFKGFKSAIRDVATYGRGAVAVGSAVFFGDCGIPVVNYDGKGRLDEDFGGDGKVLLELGASQCASGSEIAVDAQGRIVVGGAYRDGHAQGLVIMRLLPDGSLDPSFDGDGVVTSPLAGCCRGLAIQPDGKIVAGISATPQRMSVLRLNDDGSPDPSFGGGDGVAEGPALREESYAADLALSGDGRIVVAGVATDGSDCGVDEDELCSPGFAVAQLEPDGQVDTGFGDGGGTTTGVGYERQGQDYAIADSLAIQSNGRVVIGGDAWVHGCGGDGCDGTNPDIDFALARYTADGELDRSFGKRGTVLTDVERGRLGQADSGEAGVVATRDGIVQAGFAGAPDLRFTVIGVDHRGRPDRKFGKGGVSMLRPTGEAFGSALAPESRLYLGGSVNPGSQSDRFALARYVLPN